GPFILLQAIVISYFQDFMLGTQQSMMSGDFMYMNSPFEFFGDFLKYYVVILIFSILAYTMLISVAHSYIAEYAEKGRGNFTLQDVWHRTGQNFFKALGASILCGLIISIGFVFCIVPGVYLGVSLSLIFIIMFFERKSFGDSFSRSFELTKVQWWWTLLLLIVILLIIGIMTLVFSIPNMIIASLTMFHSISGDVSESMKIVYLIVNAATTFLTSFLNVIMWLVLAIQYFNIIEIKESPGLLKRIDAINTPSQNGQ
ncbi:MAG: hypothetical protein ABIJ16_07490, partial [Bacteroidota bacterium]